MLCPLDHVILYGYEHTCKDNYHALPDCVFECNIARNVLLVKTARCKYKSIFVCDANACYCCIGTDKSASRRRIVYGVKNSAGFCKDEVDMTIDMRVVDNNVLMKYGVKGNCVGMPFDELYFDDEGVLMVRHSEGSKRLELYSVNVSENGTVVVKWRYEGTYTWVRVEDTLVFRVCIRVYWKST